MRNHSVNKERETTGRWNEEKVKDYMTEERSKMFNWGEATGAAAHWFDWPLRLLLPNQKKLKVVQKNV